jgi:putative ABC transport system permease protein
MIGQLLRIDDKFYTLIGVMPHDFQFPPKTDFWQISNQMGGNIIARLAPAASIPQVKTEFDSMLARLRAEKSTYIDSDAHSEVVSLREYLVGDIGISILVLLGAVGMVMLIVCINVANLLLLRNQKRRHEMSVRAAIGATRFRLARQTIAESGLLSVFGGALGVLLAWWMIHLLPRFAPPGVLNEHGIALDMRVLLFAVLITVLTGILVALLPAVHQPWSALADAMKRSGGHEATGGRGLFHHLLVPAQIALTLAVLCGAGLMIRSFIVLRGGYPGIHNNRLMKLDISTKTRQLNKLITSALPATTLSPTAYANAWKQRDQDFEDERIQRAHTYEKMLDQIRMLPEVKRGAATNRLPGAIRSNGMIVRPKSLPANSGDTAVITYVSPDYFEILGIPVTAGRTFSKFDDQQSASRVAIINQKLANILYPGENPISKKLPTYIMGSNTPSSISEIVGVVRDFRNRGFREAPFPEAFIPLNRPINGAFAMGISVMVESHGAARPMASSFREAVAQVDPEASVYDAMTMDDYIEAFMVRDRFSVLLLSLFGAATLMLAAVGIYGVMAQSVEHRLREVAVRIALGATKGQVIRLVLRRGVVQIGCGLAAGLLGAFYITRALRSVLLQANPYDPGTFAAVLLLLLAVACLACYIPARRATKVDPLNALHCD